MERTHVESTGERTFGRQIDSQSGSGGVFDLMDRYLSADELVSYDSETFNPNLPEPSVLFAIYLCRGARLVIKDDRYYCNLKNTSHSKKKNYCHSFLQMGSLVVAEGTLKLAIGFEIIVPTKEDAEGVRYSVDWMRAGDTPNSLLDPEQFNRDLETSEKIDSTYQLENLKTLNLQKRFVVFLGPNESEFNSSCWELSVTTKLRGNSQTAQVECSLLAPQNGCFIDIQPWEAGFQQVIWRHRYERLFESVLYPVRSPGFEFAVPPEKMLCRILGIDTTTYEVKMPPICKIPQEMDKELYLTVYPKPLELVNVSDQVPCCRSGPPAPPPLHPPLWDESDQKLYYLQYGSQPIYDPIRRVFEINNQEFKLFLKTIAHFNWDFNRALRADNTNWRSFDQCSYRLASDYRIYKKTDEQLGSADICYFKRV